MKPKVSVVIPTYNRSRYILELLDSLQMQTLKDFEIILVDDGSTDGTEKRLEDAGVFYNAIPIRYIKQKNSGAATARNNGVAKAKADIIAFIDDDCLPDKEWLEKGIRQFEDPEVIGVEGIIKKEDKEPTPTSCVTYTFKKGGYMTANMFYRKSAFEAVKGFDTNFKSFREDTDLGWRVEEIGKIVHEPESIVTHRVIDYSVWQFLKKHLKLRETYWDILIYKKHPKKFLESGEVILGWLTTHTMWIYLTLLPFIPLVFELLFERKKPYLIVITAAWLLKSYIETVFLHTRMRSNVDFLGIIKHKKTFLKLLAVWWIALIWDVFQRILAIIRYGRILI